MAIVNAGPSRLRSREAAHQCTRNNTVRLRRVDAADPPALYANEEDTSIVAEVDSVARLVICQDATFQWPRVVGDHLSIVDDIAGQGDISNETLIHELIAGLIEEELIACFAEGVASAFGEDDLV